MKIYTRRGDTGDTGLFGGGRVPKDDVRVEAYGAVDELNAVLGLALARMHPGAHDGMIERLREVQADLFTLGARLATPAPEDGGRPSGHIPELSADRAAELEKWIDRYEGDVEPLRTFILPGGAEAGAALHLARTVCRRAERRVVTLARTATVDPRVIVYLNRLSDLLFVMARAANRQDDVPELPWAGGRGEAGTGDRTSGISQE